MINKAKLKYFCEIKGFTLLKLSEELDINYTTLLRKMAGETDFYRHEILKIKEILKLSVEEINSIFFDKILTQTQE